MCLDTSSVMDPGIFWIILLIQATQPGLFGPQFAFRKQPYTRQPPGVCLYGFAIVFATLKMLIQLRTEPNCSPAPWTHSASLILCLGTPPRVPGTLHNSLHLSLLSSLLSFQVPVSSCEFQHHQFCYLSGVISGQSDVAVMCCGNSSFLPRSTRICQSETFDPSLFQVGARFLSSFDKDDWLLRHRVVFAGAHAHAYALCNHLKHLVVVPMIAAFFGSCREDILKNILQSRAGKCLTLTTDMQVCWAW